MPKSKKNIIDIKNKFREGLVSELARQFDLSEAGLDGVLNDIWIKRPPSVSEFFNKDTGWFPEPLWPRQQEFVEAMVGKNPLGWNTEFDEGHAYWGKGCVSGDTILKDEDSGKEYTMKHMAENNISINVKSLEIRKGKGKYKLTNSKTGVPFKKGSTKLYRVKTKSGRTIMVSEEHKFLTKDGWEKLKDLKVGNGILINNVEKERLRSKKISESMKGKKKSKEHAFNIKNSENKTRFKKGHVPANIGVALTQKIKDRISKKLKGRKLPKKTRKRMSIANKGMKHHKQGCRCMACKVMRGELKTYRKKYLHNGYIMRSTWEVAYAKYLEANNRPYEFEPGMFLLSNGRRYTPDFYLLDTNEWIEIKGWLGRNGKEYSDKIELFKKEYSLKFTMLFKKDLEQLGVI